MRIEYLDDEGLFLSEAFRVFLAKSDLFTANVLDINLVLEVYSAYLKINSTFNKTRATGSERAMERNPSRLLLLLLKSLCEHDMSLIGRCYLRVISSFVGINDKKIIRSILDNVV